MKNRSDVLGLGSWVCSFLPISRRDMAWWLSNYLNLAYNTTYNYMLNYSHEIENQKLYNIYKKGKGTLWRNNQRYSQYEEDVIELFIWLIDSLGIRELDAAEFLAPHMGRTMASIYTRLRQSKRNSDMSYNKMIV